MTIVSRPGVMGRETPMRPERARRGPEMKRGRIPEVALVLASLAGLAVLSAHTSDADVKAKARKFASEVDAKVQQISPTLQAMMERYDPNNPRNRWWATQLTPTQLVEVTQERAKHPTATPTPFRPEPTETSTPIPTPTATETPTPEASPTVDQEALQAQIDEKIAFIQERVEELYGRRKKVVWPPEDPWDPLEWRTYYYGVYLGIAEMPYLMIQKLDPELAKALEELMKLGAEVKVGVYGYNWNWYKGINKEGPIYNAMFLVEWQGRPGKVREVEAAVIPLNESAQRFIEGNKRKGVTPSSFLGMVSRISGYQYARTQTGLVVWVDGEQVANFLVKVQFIEGNATVDNPDTYWWKVEKLPKWLLREFDNLLAERAKAPR